MTVHGEMEVDAEEIYAELIEEIGKETALQMAANLFDGREGGAEMVDSLFKDEETQTWILGILIRRLVRKPERIAEQLADELYIDARLKIAALLLQSCAEALKNA